MQTKRVQPAVSGNSEAKRNEKHLTTHTHTQPYTEYKATHHRALTGFTQGSLERKRLHEPLPG